MRRKSSFSLIAVIIVVIGSLALMTSAVSPSGASAPPTQVATVAPFSPFPDEVLDQFAGAAPSLYSNYMSVTDDVESMTMQVPSEWHDVETGRWIVKGQDVGIFIAAAPDLDRFYESSSEPGVFFGASRDLAGSKRVANPALMLNPAILNLLSDEHGNHQGRCRDGGRFAYENDFYRGQYDVYLNCVQAGQGELVVVTMPAHQEFITYLRITIINQSDLAAAAHILDTYQVTNPRLQDDHHDHDH
jgi:hypothetical protein